MGMDAQLMAFGPYKREMAGMLEYSADYYKDVKAGETVIVTVCTCPTTTQSKELADALGVDAWALGKHFFPKLTEHQIRCVASFIDEMENTRFANDFEYLAEHGFSFFYMPRG